LDVIAVQETKVEGVEQTDRMVQPFRARYNVCVCHSVGTSWGCVLFPRNTIGIVEQTVFVGEKGRLVVCDFFPVGSGA
ncbi:MAG: endonuclease/exonuclease/phosphatase family protein, partial [Anaplasma sp.]|nr:endonuclease/exonuclease/phosphatase family protein [Anaplasma sp.]